MCSLFDTDDHAGIERFLEQVGVRHRERMRYGQRHRPTSRVSIVTNRHGEAEVEDAIWHLYLQRDGDNYRPHKKYWSINSNWRKLPQRPEYRHSRCLIPATAWVESQHGERPVEFNFGLPLFFCGLYKTWDDGRLLSCSIITLSAHERTARYHEKSFPMIAPASRDFCHHWLSNDPDTTVFAPYLTPRIQYAGRTLTVAPLKQATATETLGAPQTVGEEAEPGQ
ncbi:SOS response-associated peptidase family protein [Microbulbifer guangxiensis]|uniref:SOS response-associated peptidase family protein n=1 Tax=Microbulbifer guangxiensis TaxID=2904249 RepID=UPI001F015469|nr:SOS response-associated peptidase family protein [Microbulbifer guangxiensis]